MTFVVTALTGEYLILGVLFKDGNLLDKAIGGKDCVQGVHCDRIRSILDLHQHTNIFLLSVPVGFDGGLLDNCLSRDR